MTSGERRVLFRVRARRSVLLVKVVTAILAFLLCCSNFAVTSAADYNVKECFVGSESNPLGNVSLACPQDDVISVDEALFGRNKWLACVITEGDCVEKTKIFQSCDGQNNCTRTFKTYSPQCGYISVLLLSYSCVQSFQTAAPIPTTSADEENYIWERQPAEGTIITSTQQPKNNDRDPNEIGLIIGCVVAAIATVIALIIAIVMVIRRLMQYRRKDRSEPVADAEEPRNDNGFPCMDPLSCCNSSEQDKGKMKKNTSTSNPSYSTGKSKAKSKTRMAPVGQESSTHDLTQQSEPAEASSAVDETNNDPTARDSIPHHGDYRETDQNSFNNSGDELSANVHTRANKKMQAEYIIDDSLEIPAEIRKSRIVDAKNNNEHHKQTNVQNKNYEKNMVNKSISKSKDNIDKAQSVSQESTEASSLRHARQPEGEDCGISAKKAHGEGPKYDAVAIPNTEQGTLC